MQGNRAALESAIGGTKLDKALGGQGSKGVQMESDGAWMSYAFKTVLYDLIPKIAMIIAAQAGPPEWKKWWEKVPSWDKARRIIIPLGWVKGLFDPKGSTTDSGEAAYLVMPHDFVGEMMMGALWYAAEDIPKGEWGRFLDYLLGQSPFGSVNPIFKLGKDVTNFYVRQKAPHNAWLGRPAFPDRLMRMGPAHENGVAQAEFWKYQFNQFSGGVVYRFPSYGITPVRKGLAATLRKAGIGPALTRFVRVSNRGEREAIENDPRFIKASREYETQSFEMGDMIITELEKYERKLSPTRRKALMDKLWRQAQRKGIVPDDYKKSYFKRRFESRHMMRFGGNFEKMKQYGSAGEKRALREIERDRRR
jgi:hypothetical protein